MPDFAVKATISATDKFSSVVSRMGESMGRFGTIFKGVLAGNLVTSAIQRVGGALGGIPQMLSDFAERGEKIGKTSQMLGLSADAFQRLSYAAKLTDTPTEALEGAMRKLNLAIGQGERGMGPLIKQMMRLNPQLGMQLRQTKSADTAFMLVADAISRTTNVQTRAAIVTAAFGKAGQEMLPMLLQGREGLEKMRAAAVDVIPDKTVAAADHFRQNMIVLKENVAAVRDKILSFAMTLSEKYLPPIMKWLDANRDIIATKIEGFIDRFAGALENARPVLQFLWNAAGWLIHNWPLLAAVYVGWIAAQIALNTALDANPIGLITLAIEAMIGMVIIVIHYWHEITSALTTAWNWFNKLFANPWIANALYFMLAPLWLIASVVRTVVDLLSGKGWKSFENLIPPWMKGIAGKFGMPGDVNAGHIAGPARAPNEGGMGNWQFINQVNVDNSRAPGVSSAVRIAPPITGHPGYQSAGG